MNAITFWQLCHAISLTLFVHSFYANSLQSSLVPISFMANDYRNNSWTQHMTDQWLNSSCPQQCKCANVISVFLREPIRTVNCSHQSLSSVPKSIPTDTESLILSHNLLESIFDSFSPFDHLQELNLSHNQLNHLGRGHIFHNLSHLKVLDISHNNFRQLYAGVFRGLRRLECLVLSDDHLKYLDEHAFDGLEMLSQLILSNNQLTSIYLELFQSISNLHSLNLEGNYISHLTGGIFTSMNTLRKLVLSHNKIISINDNAFVGLEQLEELYLNDNNLLRVPSIALQSLKRIITIDMDRNPLQQLSTADFVHIPAHQISVSHCRQLSLIDRGSFWDLPNINTILLHSNQNLQYIDSQAFLGVPLLHSIQLHDCGLKTIQQEIIHNIIAITNSKHEHHFKRTVRMTLKGNPLLCDCNVNYLYQCLIDQQNCSLHSPDSDEILCSEPLVLNGTRITHLNQSEISAECPPRLVSVNDANVTIHKKIGDRHQFQCRALGIPIPKIHWILPNGDILNETSNTVHFQLKITGSLRMFHLKPRDSGLYQCVAENKLGTVLSSMTLSIDNIDLHLFPISISSTYVTLVWNGTGRNSFHEYQIIYKSDNDRNISDSNSESISKSHSKYESVTVNHLLRSYTITHLEPKTKYRMCLTVRDDDAKYGYVQLSCTSVMTRTANFVLKPVTERKSNVAVAMSLSAAIFMVFVIYFSLIAAKKYKIQRQYEIPQKTPQIDNNLAPIPLENIYSPLIGNLRH